MNKDIERLTKEKIRKNKSKLFGMLRSETRNVYITAMESKEKQEEKTKRKRKN